ncbi:hypothetical protein [Myxococcus sp. RHSTA-1-4]|uniref:hypothetical protein n=1 Tax=Myxococcus sp. RHSTA-1-4 TaxID=2874601 RepID=UPI001CBBB27A|nr:hypothetical protein [Myxococcus sp. RHSTA-1-4]MBZ4419053.1 hypothetical protein [Myxococcus sp. RHSTA-1-4]
MATNNDKKKQPGDPAKKKSARRRDSRSEQLSFPEIGKLEAPRELSEHRAQQTPKKYPPGPPGKVLIFRWSKVDERTGKVIRARRRPFPMWVDP